MICLQETANKIEVCPLHGSTEDNIKILSKLTQEVCEWKAAQDERTDNIEKKIDQFQLVVTTDIKELTKCINQLTLSIVKKYVPKDDYEKDKTKIYIQIDKVANAYKESLWKIFLVGGFIFGVIQWLINMLISLGG